MALVAASRLLQLLELAAKFGFAFISIYEIHSIFQRHFGNNCNQPHASNGSYGYSPEHEFIELIARRRPRGMKDRIGAATNQGNQSSSKTEEINDSSDNSVEILGVYPATHLTSYPLASTSQEEPVDSTSQAPVEPQTLTITNVDDVSSDVISDLNQGSETTSTSLDSPIYGDEAVEQIRTNCYICSRILHAPGKEVASLPFCLHSFHAKCLDSVLKFHTRCPVCNNHIYTPL